MAKIFLIFNDTLSIEGFFCLFVFFYDKERAISDPRRAPITSGFSFLHRRLLVTKAFELRTAPMALVNASAPAGTISINNF